MGYDSAVPKDLAGTSLQIGTTLVTWVETYSWFEVDELINANASPTDETFALLEAYQSSSLASELAHPGDKHPVYNAYALNAQLSTVTGDSTTHLRQSVTWAMPGKYSSVEYETYQQTESRSFATDTVRALRPYNLTTVSYRPTSSATTNTTNFYVPFVASLRVPSVLQAVQVTQWEIFTGDKAAPSSIMDIDRPFWNSDGIWGFQPGQLLYMGRKASTEGSPLHRVTYTFLKNMYTWAFFFAVYQDARGLTPQDITPIDPQSLDPTKTSADSAQNGTGAFKMLLGKKFSDYFAGLKLPFNQGPAPTFRAPQPNTLGVGDFFPFPENIA